MGGEQKKQELQRLLRTVIFLKADVNYLDKQTAQFKIDLVAAGFEEDCLEGSEKLIGKLQDKFLKAYSVLDKKLNGK